MNPTELEELLRGIPELAPSPDLEGRIVEAAKHRTASRPWFRGLLPAAAALFFGVSVVWMALPTPGGKGKPEGPFLVRFVHEEGLWTVFAGDRPVRNQAELDVVIPRVAERGVVLVGPESTPWGLVQPVRKACAKAGISRNEWRIANRLLEVPTPRPRVPRLPGAPELVRLEEIVAVLRRAPGSDVTIRRIGPRKPVDSHEELIQLILRMAVDYKKAGKSEIRVYIDGGPDIPWGEIVFLMEAVRKAGIDLIDPDRPDHDEPDKFEKVWYGPDKKLFPPPEEK